MSSIPTQIVGYTTRKVVEALIHTDLPQSVLIETEKVWGPFRRNAARRLVNGGYPTAKIPSHSHWDWGNKSNNLKLLAYRCFGIECDNQLQGLMMVQTAGKFARYEPDISKPLIYIDYCVSLACFLGKIYKSHR